MTFGWTSPRRTWLRRRSDQGRSGRLVRPTRLAGCSPPRGWSGPWKSPFGPWLDQLIRDHYPLPLAGKLALTFGDVIWAPAVTLGITLPLLLLPDGRLRSPRWRLAVAASLAGAVLVPVGGLTPRQLVSWSIANPLGLAGWAGTAANAADTIGGVLHVGSLAAALVCVVLRFRASRGVERQQLRWVVTGAGVGVAGVLLVTVLLVGGALHGFASSGWQVVAVLALPACPPRSR